MKISIITITYNSEDTLEDTIKSVISQGYEDLEYIIVDGGSTDGTLDIIKKYEKSITKWISEPDRGISDAFNKGIRMSEGELIGIINSDDMLMEGALKKIGENIEPDTGVFFGHGIRVYQNGRTKPYLADPDISRLNCDMSFVHPATFVKKEAYETVGMFDVDLKMVMDRELLLRMLRGGVKFQFFDGFLAYYRMGGVSDKNFLKLVVPESERISIKYGMPKWKAKMYSVKSRIVFCLVVIRDFIKNMRGNN